MNKIMKTIRKTNEGAAVLIIVIIMGSAMLLIALSLGISSISENLINLYQSQSSRLSLSIDGCAEEALIRLNRDNSYNEETLSIGGTSCTISVSGSGSSRTINVAGTKSDYSRELEIAVNISPTYAITSWQELTT
ncbi:hypothetical protein ACFL3C_00505 [Patescibacteria group bacterium]